MAPSDTARVLHLLLATDRSPASEAHLAFAMQLSKALGARTTLFHAVLPRPLVVNAAMSRSGSPPGEDVDEARQSLTEMASALAAGQVVTVAVEESNTAEDAILAVADRIGADLIVLPSHGRTGVSRAAIGSTAELVMRRATCPVLLLTDRMLDSESLAAVMPGPVVLATDLSAAARVAHRPAAEFALRLGLPVHLLSVVPHVEPLPYSLGAPVSPPQPDAAALFDHRSQQLRDAAAELDPEVRRDVEVLIDDDVAGAIVKVAKARNASLLVLATHGRRGITRLLEGSIAEQVVRHATVPVVCMHVPKG